MKEYCMRKELFLVETTFNQFETSHDVESCSSVPQTQKQVRTVSLESLREEETRGDSAKKREDMRKTKALLGRAISFEIMSLLT